MTHVIRPRVSFPPGAFGTTHLALDIEQRLIATEVDVEYRSLTGDGKLQHPPFKGVREDH